MLDKMCTACRVVKPLRAYHRNGKDNYCKDCRARINNANYLKRKASGIPKHIPGELSTQAGLAILWQQGIPSCFGSAMGHTWVDLLAWGCVPIEAKLSNGYVEGNINKHKWGFTEGERGRGFKGAFLFIARTPERDRVFVIPCDSPFLQTGGKPNRTALSVVFGADHFNAYVEPLLLEWEDRYDVIESLRKEYSRAMKAQPVMDYSLWGSNS